MLIHHRSLQLAKELINGTGNSMKYLLITSFVAALAVLVCGFVLCNDESDYDLAIGIYEYKDADGIHTGYKIVKGELYQNDIEPFLERISNTLREGAGLNLKKL